MDSFWNSSWERVDAERLTQYIGSHDFKLDAFMQFMRMRNVKTVCDAGCGCGMYTLKLALNGFEVSGFDLSARAVEIARRLLEDASVWADLKVASILSTGYRDGQFDCVVSRSVIDHMSKAQAVPAISELYRIVRPGGIVLITLDHSDSEYESEPHAVNADGDYVFTEGKWKGMVFHSYSEQEIIGMIPPGAPCRIENGEDEIVVKLIKQLYP